MANDGYAKTFDGLLKIYLFCGDNAGTIVRRLKKTPNAATRSKFVGELRTLDKKRLELRDQMDNVANSIPQQA